MGYDPPKTDVGWIRREFAHIKRQISELQRPTSGQINKQLATLQDLVNNLAEKIEQVAASGATWQGPVNTTGTVKGDAGVSSVGVYSNLLTVAYRVQYITSTGPMGYVPSSRRFKQDIQPAPDMSAAALAMQVVTFRYIQAVEKLGDGADVEWGVIAEDLHDLGFTWLIDYDDEGLPAGVKKEQLIFAFIPVIQDHEARLAAAGL
jgi:hypothetical protein